ncbi:MAG: hypothetical protein KGJ07_01680 [Patescibacteria group bacterium]|nr:hypothetical protein [Patescibacteria group bacterium]
MQSEVLYFISRQHIAAATIQLPDKSLYPAVMHVAHRDAPFSLLFLTDKTSKKLSSLQFNNPIPAGVVLGFNEQEFTTLQMQGIVKEVPVNQREELETIYFLKFPWKQKLAGDNTSLILIEFIPHWWKYTDYATSPRTVLSSASM